LISDAICSAVGVVLDTLEVVLVVLVGGLELDWSPNSSSVISIFGAAAGEQGGECRIQSVSSIEISPSSLLVMS